MKVINISLWEVFVFNVIFSKVVSSERQSYRLLDFQKHDRKLKNLFQYTSAVKPSLSYRRVCVLTVARRQVA